DAPSGCATQSWAENRCFRPDRFEFGLTRAWFYIVSKIARKPEMTAPLRRYGFEDAERCVQCALCLTHCPTYRLTHDESESPRGRLAMLAAWDRDEAPLDPSMRRALDHCLGCLACEAVCPAEVPYGKLIDRYHEVTASPTRAPSVRLLVWLTHQHGKAAWLHRLLAG
ncbi:glycolate oxidase iron-sulfur subunit, partial [mine drainage metagenome]